MQHSEEVVFACSGEREFLLDNLLVRLHFIIMMIKWTGLAPWKLMISWTGLA